MGECRVVENGNDEFGVNGIGGGRPVIWLTLIASRCWHSPAVCRVGLPAAAAQLARMNKTDFYRGNLAPG